METIVQGTKTIAFAHDSEHARIKQLNDADTTYYLNGAGVASEYRVTLTTETWVDYIFAGGTRIAVRKEKTEAQTTTTEVSYFVADHLGSIAVITDDQGTVTERLAYDAWGKRRELGGIDDLTNAITSAETRGFTGHEMLDDVSLVHMNGRIYDPALGRFLSADPVTQDWYDPQTLNRYSYVGNNPLSRTDPTGHFFKKLFKNIFRAIKKFIRPILAIAAAATLQFYALPAIGISNVYAAAAISGAVAGGINGGNLKSALIGAGTALAFAGVHTLKEALFGVELAPGWNALSSAAPSFGERLASIGLHGLVGGLAADLQGGKFGAGFLSAGFADFAGPLVDVGIGLATNVAKHAILGGVGSVLGGGKFQNGAITGAFGYLYNDILIRLYRDAVGGQGHIGIAVVDRNRENFDDVETVGFYPAGSGLGKIRGPGEMRTDDADALGAYDEVVIPTTPEQDEVVRQAIQEQFDDPGEYRFIGRNCSDVAQAIIAQAGVETPQFTRPYPAFEGIYRNNPTRHGECTSIQCPPRE